MLNMKIKLFVVSVCILGACTRNQVAPVDAHRDTNKGDGQTDSTSVDTAMDSDGGLNSKVQVTEIREIFGAIHGAAVGDDGRIFLSDSFGQHDKVRRVYYVDPPYDGAIVSTGIEGQSPAGLMWHQNRLWVCDVAGGTIRSFDTDFSLDDTILAEQPWNVANVGDEVLFVNGKGTVANIKTPDQPLVKNLLNPFGIAGHSDGRFVVTQQGPNGESGGVVATYDKAGKELARSQRAWKNPEGIALDRHGAMFVVDTAAHELVQVETDKEEVVSSDLDLPVVLTRFLNGDLLLVTVGPGAKLYRISG